MNKIDIREPIAAPETAEDNGWLEANLAPSARTKHRAKRFWKWLSLALPNASAAMFRQKITSLDVAQYLTPGEDGRLDHGKLRARIKELRARAASPLHRNEWSIVNEIELLLLGLMRLEELRVEARRQLIDARALDLTAYGEYEAMIQRHEDDEPALRATLVRLVMDVQGRFRKRYLLREFIAAYTARVSLVFAVATTFFIALMIGLSALAYDLSIANAAAKLNTGYGPVMAAQMDNIRAFSSFYVAIAAGLFGAAFSMMAKTRKRIEGSSLEDMRANARFGMLLFRLGVGIGAAMILYFIFDAKVLGDGSLTPSLTAVGFDGADKEPGSVAIGALSPNKDLSLLMLWCFVAGFSEVMVPSILRQAESATSK
ncbi:MAG: hypothetical protein AAFN79_20005 [Pseudomonadota bacterium]